MLPGAWTESLARDKKSSSGKWKASARGTKIQREPQQLGVTDRSTERADENWFGEKNPPTLNKTVTAKRNP
jgi:hypothetical protein